MSAKKHADRAYSLTERGLRAAGAVLNNLLGPPRPPRCRECNQLLAHCVCLDLALRSRQ